MSAIKKEVNKKVAKKVIKGTPISKIIKATNELRKKNVDLSFLGK